MNVAIHETVTFPAITSKEKGARISTSFSSNPYPPSSDLSAYRPKGPKMLIALDLALIAVIIASKRLTRQLKQMETWNCETYRQLLIDQSRHV